MVNKLYHFNPNDYGAEYYILAETKTKAHEFLLKHFENKIVTDLHFSEQYKEDLDIWRKVNPLDIKTFPSKYTLNEYENGSVIQSEIA
jgi:hypothetical protein